MNLPVIAASGFLKAYLFYSAAQAPDYLTTEIGIHRGTLTEMNWQNTSAKRALSSVIGPAIIASGDQMMAKKSKKAQKIFRIVYVVGKLAISAHNAKIAFGKR